ncbi:hypothetical protein ACJCYG_003389, partial [Enterobacter ludwigii]
FFRALFTGLRYLSEPDTVPVHPVSISFLVAVPYLVVCLNLVPFTLLALMKCLVFTGVTGRSHTRLPCRPDGTPDLNSGGVNSRNLRLVSRCYK